MRIIVEGTEQQCNDLARRVRHAVENARKVSKFYPNARGSIVDHDGRMFVNIDDQGGRDIVDALAGEMFAILGRAIKLHAVCPRIEINEQASIEKIKSFYDAGKRGLTQSELFKLYDVWCSEIFERILGGLKGFEDE